MAQAGAQGLASDEVSALLTFYDAIMRSIDRWINVSWTFASIFIPASMVLAGIVMSVNLESWMTLVLSSVCLMITLCWGLLWYRTYMFNIAHLDQLTAIENYLSEKLGIPSDLCPQLTIVKKLRSKFGWRSRFIKIKHTIFFICGILSLLWLLMFMRALMVLLA